jgi:tetratricopeptide (TPR) repeat protein
MLKSRLLLALTSSLAMAACATSRPGLVASTTLPAPPAAKTPDFAGGDSAYGLFLAGEAAQNSGQGDAAAAYFDRAAGLDPGEPAALLGTHAFSALLLAGEVTRAAANAPTDDTVEPVIRRLGVLTQGVEALATGDSKAAYAKLTGPDIGAPYSGVAQLLAPFAAAGAGDFRAATVHPVIDGEPIAQFYANLDQGKIFEHFHHFDEAETAYRALITGGDPGGIASLALGALLERRGRSAEAAAIYATAMARNPNETTLAAARTRALARRPAPPPPTLRQSAAEALVAPATVLIIQKQYEVGLAYLRLALRLDPGRDEAWVLVGDVLTNVGDQEGARAAYMIPKPGTADYVTARGKLAWSYQDAGEKEKALSIAEAAHASAPDDQEAATTLADLFRADERYDDSVKVLDSIIRDQGDRTDWRLLYMRAVDFQASDHWPDAERDLSRALAEDPEEPELLNFLGYAWIDRGENLPRALAMVKKAVSLNPDSGAMVDSLGWAYYRLGDYKSAVEQLESAVVLEAGDAEINDHLGDAYWRVGRKSEAEFQWRRVLTLEPTPKLRAKVEEKIKSGLGAPASPGLAGS